MTSNECKEVLKVAEKLWPRQWAETTEEIIGTWIRVFSANGNAPACIAALRGWAESSRYCPHPSEIRERLQVLRAAPTTGTGTKQSLQDFYRVRWAKEDPANDMTIRNMTDEAVNIEIARFEFRRSAEVYGPESRATAEAWIRLQSLTAPAKVSSCFEADPTGKAKAAAIHERYVGGQMEQAA